MPQILRNTAIAPNVSRLWLEAATIARKRQPGQFVIIRIDEAGERIPLTIADVDVATGAIAVIVQAVGKTTRQLCAMRAGERIADLAGPLGHPTEITAGERVCCIGGGIGTAVVYPIACGVKAKGGHVTAIVGGRSKDLVLLEEELRAIADQVIVTTDDGSYGRHGLVTDALKDLLARGASFDNVVAVGPIRMMQAVCEVTRPLGLRTTVSLNPVMVDGTGMCGGCRVSIDGEPKFVCVDGPEFDGHKVDFAELAARLEAYRDQERLAAERALQIAAVGMEAW
jgi:ferredoxin--NADP+ reductase